MNIPSTIGTGHGGSQPQDNHGASTVNRSASSHVLAQAAAQKRAGGSFFQRLRQGPTEIASSLPNPGLPQSKNGAHAAAAEALDDLARIGDDEDDPSRGYPGPGYDVDAILDGLGLTSKLFEEQVERCVEHRVVLYSGAGKMWLSLRDPQTFFFALPCVSAASRPPRPWSSHWTAGMHSHNCVDMNQNVTQLVFEAQSTAGSDCAMRESC